MLKDPEDGRACRESIVPRLKAELHAAEANLQTALRRRRKRQKPRCLNSPREQGPDEARCLRADVAHVPNGMRRRRGWKVEIDRTAVYRTLAGVKKSWPISSENVLRAQKYRIRRASGGSGCHSTRVAGAFIPSAADCRCAGQRDPKTSIATSWCHIDCGSITMRSSRRGGQPRQHGTDSAVRDYPPCRQGWLSQSPEKSQHRTRPPTIPRWQVLQAPFIMTWSVSGSMVEKRSCQPCRRKCGSGDRSERIRTV